MLSACDSRFLFHKPCPKCGSSDGNSVYSNGGEHCFVCGYTKRGDGKHVVREAERKAKDMDWIQGKTQWLEKRKITKATCDFVGYSIGSYNGQPAQIENFYSSGTIIAQHLRLPGKEFRWIGESKLAGFYGRHLWAKTGRILVVTEGAIDMLSIIQVTEQKVPVVSLPNGADSALAAFKRDLEWVNSFHKVILAFDNDGPGREAITKVAEILPAGKAWTLPMGDYKDANEMLMDGQGLRLAKAVYEPQEYRPDGIVAGGELWEALISENEQGLELPYKELSEKLKGLRPAQLVTITAGSGIGKTTFTREIGYHLMMHHKQTIGVIPLEENKKKTAKYWVGLHLNKLLHVNINSAPPEDLKRGYEEVLNCGRFFLYDHWGSTAINTLLSKIQYMAVSLGCTWVILDHISIVVSDDQEGDESERKTLDRLMTRLRTLVNSTGVGILAIVHLKRPPGEESFNTGREVSLSDLRGSASIEQLSDVVISLERDQQSESKNVALIRLLKDRDVGDTGPAGYAHYNKMTGRLLPTTEVEAGFKTKQKLKRKQQQETQGENPDF